MFIWSIVLFIIGLVTWIILAYVNKRKDKLGFARVIKWPGWSICVLGIVLFLLSFLKVVPAGNVGIPVLFGDVKEYTYSSGLNTRVPWLSVINFPTRVQEYTMSIAQGEGRVQQADAIDVLPKDGVRTLVDGTIRWKIDKNMAGVIYDDIAVNITELEEKVIRPICRRVIREVAEKYTSTELYAGKRLDYADSITRVLEKEYGKYNVILDGFDLRNVKLPESVETAIEKKRAAIEYAEEEYNLIEAERMKSARKAVEAEGIAVANEKINRSLTPEYLAWYEIEMRRVTLLAMAASPNNTVVFVPNSLDVAPLVNIR